MANHVVTCFCEGCSGPLERLGRKENVETSTYLGMLRGA